MDGIEDDTSYISSIVACVFVAAVMFLSSRCLAMVGCFQTIQVSKIIDTNVILYIGPKEDTNMREVRTPGWPQY
jgi:hypothetical protein